MTLNSYKKLIAGVIVGNLMEFFDFIVYVYLSTYISKNFFPNEDIFTSKILTFSVFASGYLTRPLGAVFFGYIGDRFGRKIALIQSIVLITTATACIGLLPVYSSIGIIAPLLLVTCRLIQGFAISGEQGGAAVYLSESVGQNKNGFIGAIILGSTYFGVLLGSLTCLVVSSFLSVAEMSDYGWRIPFLLSIILGIASFILRVSAMESVQFKKVQDRQLLSAAPVKETFAKHWSDILIMILLVMALAVPIYMYTVYLPNYIAEFSEFGLRKSLIFSTIALFFVSFLVPVMGSWSDKIGHEKVLGLGIMLSATLGYPIFVLFSFGTEIAVGLGLFFMGTIVSLIAAPMFSVLISMFPVQLRYTGVSFVFNTSMAIFGSTTPLVSITLIHLMDDKAFPGMYLSLSALIGFFALCYYYYHYNLLPSERLDFSGKYGANTV